MKRLLFTIALISAVASVNAQEAAVDTSWKKGGIIGLNFTQVSLSNWAAGGQNSISGIALFNYYANYNKGKNIWDNTIDLGYGMTQNGDADPIKSEDKDIPSPYNTYRNKGLPPHPIDNPGIDAIKAVLYPEETECMFYLHDKSKTIHCAKTFEEHKENIATYLND